MKPEILRQKLIDFVAPRMRADGIAQWLVLTREGSRDPIADRMAGGTAVGRMAIAIRPTPGGVELHAVCASYDLAPLEDSGLFTGIQSYGEKGWGEPLGALVGACPDGRIAVNSSADEPLGDGLSHTLREELLASVSGDPSARLVSSEPLVGELFGRKTSWEIQRIRQAAVEAERILRWALSPECLTPDDTTEAELAERIAQRVESHGYGFAWERSFCPSVQFATTRGHAAPGSATVSFGELACIDFGLSIDGYVSDLQRTMVICERDAIPDDVAGLWRTTRAAVDAAARRMRPGVTGLEVDAAARSVIHRSGYVDYIHATGHPLGYDVHDVGPMLGPNWPGRYGKRVHQELQESMVMTLEPAAAIEREDGLLRVGLEEDVVVRADGVEYLAPPQLEIWTYDDRS